MVVQEVVYLATIDFVHGNGDCKISFVLLEIGDASIK